MQQESPDNTCKLTYESVLWLCHTLEQVYEKIQEEFDKGCSKFQLKHDEFDEGHDFELTCMK